MGSFTEDINNLKMWKYVSFKNHNCFVSKPKLNTPWVNRLSNISGYTTTSDRFILSDPFGDKIGVSLEYLFNYYKFSNGEAINENSLNARLEDGLMDWEEIVSKQGAYFWVFHLDLNKYGNKCRNYQIKTNKGILIANRSGVQHGVGDFLVCEDRFGKPDFNKMSVVNGRLFVVMYSMNAFKGLVSHEETICKAERPATIFTPEKYNDIQERKANESKKEIASQLEQCYDVLGLCTSSLLLMYYGNYLSKVDANISTGFLMNSNINGGVLTTNTSGKVSAYATSVLNFSSGTKLFLRMAISKDNEMVCNLQLVDKNNAVINSMLSNNTELCKSYLFLVRKYRDSVDNIVKSSFNDLLHKQGKFIDIANYYVQTLNRIDKNIFATFMKSGEQSFSRCMSIVLNDFKG